MYPYFDLAHAALCCLAVREDLSVGKQQPFILNGDCLRTFKLDIQLDKDMPDSQRYHYSKTLPESRHFTLENCVRI